MKNMLILFCLLTAASVVAQESNNRPGCLDELDIPESIGICGDGANTTWGIHFPCPPDKFKITIYNRWGNLIYESDNYKFQWLPVDTKKNPLPAGVYLYNLEYLFQGEEKQLTGNVTVIC